MLALGVAAAAFSPPPLLMHLAVLITIQAVVLSGLVVLMGYTGQISIGHAAFYGMGAYAAGLLAKNLGLPFPAAVAVATGFTTVVAVVIGVPCLRLRGYYLSLATMAFGLTVFVFLREWRPVTGGTSGLKGIPYPALGGWVLDRREQFFVLAWVVLAACIFFIRNLGGSHHGRVLRCIRADETCAAVMGINVQLYKVFAFALSGLTAGLGGSLLSFYMRYIRPEMFGLDTSVLFLLMVFIGGAGNPWGSVLGVTIFTLIADFLAHLHDWNTIVYAVLLIVVMTYFPGGIAGGIDFILRYVTRVLKSETKACF